MAEIVLESEHPIEGKNIKPGTTGSSLTPGEAGVSVVGFLEASFPSVLTTLFPINELMLNVSKYD